MSAPNDERRYVVVQGAKRLSDPSPLEEAQAKAKELKHRLDETHKQVKNRQLPIEIKPYLES